MRFEELIVKKEKERERKKERRNDRLRKQNNRIGKRGMRYSIPRSCQVKSQGQGRDDSGQSSSPFLLPCSFFPPLSCCSILLLTGSDKISIPCTRYLYIYIFDNNIRSKTIGGSVERIDGGW